MPNPVGRPARYRATPLYRLRKAISGKVPMTMPMLSERLDVPLPTLKCLGNRPMSRNLMQKIWLFTGAIWQEKKKQWFYDLGWIGGNAFTLMTPDLYNRHYELLTSTTFDAEDLPAMHAWLDQLFKRIPSHRLTHLRLRYNLFIQECCRDFELGDPDLWTSTTS